MKTNTGKSLVQRGVQIRGGEMTKQTTTKVTRSNGKAVTRTQILFTPGQPEPERGDPCVLCDTSSSMAGMAGARVKIEIVKEALTALSSAKARMRLIAFDSLAREIAMPSLLPAPAGGTAMDLGLRMAADSEPQRVLVISDGCPNDKAAALEAARGLGCPVDIIYCGPDSDVGALKFMQSLAGATNGRVVATKPSELSTRSLIQTASSMLALPEMVQRRLCLPGG